MQGQAEHEQEHQQLACSHHPDPDREACLPATPPPPALVYSAAECAICLARRSSSRTAFCQRRRQQCASSILHDPCMFMHS
ncbi:hypothetical protein BDA96_04G005200 [Sorghum bicolor]|uniref:Uncharacterized protein n=1 Tax=Sorghum bicolor TaxID=4558 RepID=A0A921UH12_SORBI|nr:hypothetical protein BDA96_04G005200 [Sorghum bicolor]